MLAELKSKSQVTIPKEIVNKLNLTQGDLFEITEQHGKIVLIPVKVHPQHVINELREDVAELKKSIEKGESPVFDSIDDLFEELDK